MSTFTHAPPYSISGQLGKSLGPTRLPIESLGVSTLAPEFTSMDVDTVEWTQRGGDAPEWMQEISIWDGTGRRIFTGNVTAADPTWDGTGLTTWAITVSGPWWWLEQAELTSLVGDAFGNSAERMNFVFAEGDLATSLRTLLDKMQSLGVPLRAGTIDPTFVVPQMTLQGDTAADALRSLLGWLPDAMTSVRYDTDGLPALDITRRLSTAPIPLDVSSGCLAAPPSLIAERSLRPASVSVQSMRVTDAGERVYDMQTAGDITGETGILGRQLLAVSGPGRPDYKEVEIDTVTLRTLTNLTSLFYAKHAALADTGGTSWILYLTQKTVNMNGLPRTITGKQKWVVNGNPGTAGTYLNWVIGENLPDWWIEHGVKPQECSLTASFYGDRDAMNDAERALSTGYDYYAGIVYCELTISFQAIPLSYPTTTTIVRPRDRSLVQPHPSLAEKLYAAQNWVPYTGTVPLVPGTAEIPLPGSILNIRGALPEWATMGALVTGTQLDLSTGAASLTLGAPPRLRATALIDQFQRATGGRMINL